MAFQKKKKIYIYVYRYMYVCIYNFMNASTVCKVQRSSAQRIKMNTLVPLHVHL